ncbi:MAG: glutamine synthetase beta-grasp domain-containing protein, partial [Candidatus Omnitrophica bacterium]|nr:glutamine synthetase beta-grasp domain-containing protein [Candidatus Omnitrophota bacterium]
MEQEYLSPTEAAKILGISRQGVIERIKHGNLYAERVGNRYIIPKNALTVDGCSPANSEHDTGDNVKRKANKNDLIGSILEKVRKSEIRTIQLWFVDILGILKCISITPGELKDVLEHGKGFDGSSVTGFAEAQESDIIAMPDAATFKILPWTKETNLTARLFCDILNPDQTPYAGDPRHVLKKALARAKKLGFTFYVGPEIEYFYFKSN